MRSSIRKFANFNCEAQAPSTLPALGFAFNATSPQFATLFTPLLLPSTGPNPNITVPVINDTISTGTGIKIQVAGIYQISYTLTISLDNVPVAPEAARFFLTLNSSTNVIAYPEPQSVLILLELVKSMYQVASF